MHDEAPDVDATDWPQILALYDLLDRVAPNPVSSLSRVVAVARVHGPAAGLGALAELESDRRVAGYHRLLATRAHLLGLAGQHGPAAAPTGRRRGGPPACPSAGTSAGWPPSRPPRRRASREPGCRRRPPSPGPCAPPRPPTHGPGRAGAGWR